MTQFDVHRNLGTSALRASYFVVIQHDHIVYLRTVLVVPMLRASSYVAQERVAPFVDFAGEN